MQRLLELDFDPNHIGSPAEEELGLTPLHLAICINNRFGISNPEGNAKIQVDCSDTDQDTDQVILEQSLLVIEILLKSGANINQQLKVHIVDIIDNCENATLIVTPLVLAVICGSPKVARALLDAGAKFEAVVCRKMQGAVLVSSLEELLDVIPRHKSTIQNIIDLGGHQILKERLEKWKVYRERLDCGSLAISDDCNDGISPQELFVEAYQNGSWDDVGELITTWPEIEINRNDNNGLNALYYASATAEDTNALVFLLECKADPNLFTSAGFTALKRTVVEGSSEKMALLLQSGANIECSDRNGYTPLLLAIHYGRPEMVELLLENGADLNATHCHGTGVLNLAMERSDTKMFSFLLAYGADPILSDNYGSTPLHVACIHGLEFEVDKLLEVASDPAQSANHMSIWLGTPLYVAARQGFNKLVEKLVDNGAEIDKIGQGNLLGPALMVACAHGHESTVNLLLSRGASQEVDGSRFKSAIGTARAFRREAIVKILESTAVVQVEKVE